MVSSKALYGEVSQHLHDLLSRFASCRVDALGRSSGRPVSEEERGQILHWFRRELSVTAVRAQASCLLSRLGHMGPGAKDAARRRELSKQVEEMVKRHARAHWEAGVRGQRLLHVGRLRL